jgi:hypothetical protein
MRCLGTTTADREAPLLLQSWNVQDTIFICATIAAVAICRTHGDASAGAANLFGVRITSNLSQSLDFRYTKPRIVTDFGDLHDFNIAFEHLDIQNPTVYESADVCDVVWLTADGAVRHDSNRAFMTRDAETESSRDIEVTSIRGGTASWSDEGNVDGDDASPLPAVFSSSGTQRNGVGVVYGLRAFDSQDPYEWQGFGGILGRAFSNTDAGNQILAPQIGFIWANSLGKWMFEIQGTALAGYNTGRIEQHNGIGEQFIPGALNRPLYAQPAYTSHVENHHDFSPGGEIRVQTTYRFTDSIVLHIAWSELYLDNVLLSDNRVNFYLPSMGLLDPGDQQFLTQNLYCGIEYVR